RCYRDWSSDVCSSDLGWPTRSCRASGKGNCARSPSPRSWPAQPVPRSVPGGEPSQEPQRKLTHPIRVVVYVRTASTSKKVLDVRSEERRVGKECGTGG